MAVDKPSLGRSAAEHGARLFLCGGGGGDDAACCAANALAVKSAERNSGWEKVANVLTQHVCFFRQFGKKPCRINGAAWTLTPSI
jgi:hypothetical protein